MDEERASRIPEEPGQSSLVPDPEPDPWEPFNSKPRWRGARRRSDANAEADRENDADTNTRL